MFYFFIINKEIALNTITPETLLLIVDTHKTSYVEAPELLEKTNKIGTPMEFLLYEIF